MAMDNEMLGEVRIRELDKFVVENANDETVEHLMKTRGMKLLYDARPVELVHELRRQMCGNWDFDNYHHNEKKRAVPHAIDEVGVDIMEKADDVVRGTRSKKGKWVKTRVEHLALYAKQD